MTKFRFLTGLCLMVFAGSVWASCPAVTVADMQGVPAGEFPQQYDLAEFEKLAGCELEFSENPEIAELNSRIRGNPVELPPMAERLAND